MRLMAMKLCTYEGTVKTFQNVRNSVGNLQDLSKRETVQVCICFSVKLSPILSSSQKTAVFLVSSTVSMMLIFREQASASASSQGAYLITVFEQDALEGQNCTQKQSTLNKTAFQNHF